MCRNGHSLLWHASEGELKNAESSNRSLRKTVGSFIYTRLYPYLPPPPCASLTCCITSKSSTQATSTSNFNWIYFESKYFQFIIFLSKSNFNLLHFQSKYFQFIIFWVKIFSTHCISSRSSTPASWTCRRCGGTHTRRPSCKAREASVCTRPSGERRIIKVKTVLLKLHIHFLGRKYCFNNLTAVFKKKLLKFLLIRRVS